MCLQKFHRGLLNLPLGYVLVAFYFLAFANMTFTIVTSDFGKYALRTSFYGPSAYEPSDIVNICIYVTSAIFRPSSITSFFLHNTFIFDLSLCHICFEKSACDKSYSLTSSCVISNCFSFYCHWIKLYHVP